MELTRDEQKALDAANDPAERIPPPRHLLIGLIIGVISGAGIIADGVGALMASGPHPLSTISSGMSIIVLFWTMYDSFKFQKTARTLIRKLQRERETAIS